jgi:hypothetical protein
MLWRWADAASQEKAREVPEAHNCASGPAEKNGHRLEDLRDRADRQN